MSMSTESIVRKPLLNVNLTRKIVSKVDGREITFQPGQQTGRHLHPCPVIGYIAEGTAELEVEGQPKQLLPTGSAFYEPAEVVVARFDNASETEPMKFIAYYLLEASEPLIEMLPDSIVGRELRSR